MLNSLHKLQFFISIYVLSLTKEKRILNISSVTMKLLKHIEWKNIRGKNLNKIFPLLLCGKASDHALHNCCWFCQSCSATVVFYALHFLAGSQCFFFRDRNMVPGSLQKKRKDDIRRNQSIYHKLWIKLLESWVLLPSVFLYTISFNCMLTLSDQQGKWVKCLLKNKVKNFGWTKSF